MQNLRHYLIDCENKRRRMRDRPSNVVLAELRTLLRQFEEAAPETEGAEESMDSSMGSQTSASA